MRSPSAPGECDGVGRHHPLQSSDTAAEGAADAVDGDIDDRHVELHYAVAEAHGRERHGLGARGSTDRHDEAATISSRR
jgi:hypothetical protein